MRFFSELGSCFNGGGAAATPAAAETCSSSLRSSSRQRDERGAMNSGGRSSHEVAATVEGLRKMKSASTSRNWKPKLHVISEDGVVLAHDSSPSVGSNDKLSVKVKAKCKPTVSSSFTHGDDYWKSSSLWALPAFSPTPFLF